MPNLARNLMPWYILLPKIVDFSWTDDPLKRFETKRKDFPHTTTTILRLVKPGQQ